MNKKILTKEVRKAPPINPADLVADPRRLHQCGTIKHREFEQEGR